MKTLPSELLNTYINHVEIDPSQILEQKEKEALPVDYFQFHYAISSVYSSKIEGDEIDVDSFYIAKRIIKT